MLRAVEEFAYTPADLRAARAIARGGLIGGITIDTGRAVAAVTQGHDAFTVEVTVPALDAEDVDLLTDVVASGAGHIAALLEGQLPHPFVEAVEETGIELLPYGGELGSSCSCEGWLDPCPHALAVLIQLSWVIHGEPLVLLHLRGLPREELLARLHSRQQAAPPPAESPDLDTALEAVLRVRRLLRDEAAE